ncbi:hypothetical protein [Flavobacterium piscis]|uniref:Class IIb bacteriocin, lactobin A/cerein 7B family n=1 Tax=Flavobacterium piscis TaxID=1114874 RepID=A0ABU1Y6C4_9FLAO|nr:hypothetical protein [Flavobacterium piscis]MDR7209780.1 hypothetical protein [Flavobacterium piscis]
MKKSELNQMENLEGGIDQRNCGLLGAAIVGGAIAGLFSFGGGWFLLGQQL